VHDKFQLLKMADEISNPRLEYTGWADWGKEICYKENATTAELCGPKDACHTKGLLLPLFLEVTWPKEARAVIYFVGLCYSFLGVSIVADVFMCAIEKITSKTKQIHVAGQGDKGEEEIGGPEVIEVPVWNGTVANLTLMALGSSAPEILLSVIEIVGNNFEAGELGPGTIVGSAAFNLLVISAVCVVGVPKGETRRIDIIVVFAVTSFFCVFAYIWLLIILKVSTPNVVDIWEAVMTFLFFPILVVLAYCADKGWMDFLMCKTCTKSSGLEVMDKQRQIELGTVQPGETEEMLRTQDYFKNGQLDKNGLVKFIKDVKKNTKLSDEDAAVLAASKIVDSKPHSRMWYRIGAVRNMTGGRKTQPATKMSDKLKEVYDAINENPDAPNIQWPDEGEEKAIIEFHASTAAVMESIGTYKLHIIRHGRMDETVKVRLETIDGSAVEEEDYKPLNETLTFEPNERTKEIGLEIVDDNQWEPDEEFFVKLTLIPQESENVRLGRTSIMEITILNDDEPGTITFEKRGYLVKESCGEAEIAVLRQNGADGQISIKWRTIDKSAVGGKDYTGGEDVCQFEHGETHQLIKIPIIDDMEFEKDENFEIELFEPEGGAKLGKINRTAVTITNDDEFNSVLNKMLLMTNANVDSMRVHHETWAQQLKDAMNVNGGDVENASTADYIMHFLTFGFKIIFALIPPAGMGGGWPCFFVSLGMIGLLTAIVGDLASIFGCLVGLKDSVTAITFVALGTSLPDTFASKAAATAERSADNAIGNVTGSNSVNVFLGLGLPWMMASIYHAIKGNEFAVKDEALGFSVLLYSITTILAIILLMLRRKLNIFGNAELGGTVTPKYVSGIILVLLWFSYVLLSSLQAYEKIKAPF
jgi:solute carrier family 8 (sodium/calcium exchanger)